MSKHHAVRLFLIATTAVGSLVSAGSASAQSIIKEGKDCRTTVGFTDIIDNKICARPGTGNARITCNHSGPAVDVLQMEIFATDNRTDNSVACGAVGSTNGNQTFAVTMITDPEKTGDEFVRSRRIAPNSTEDVELECTLPASDNGLNCLNLWFIHR